MEKTEILIIGGCAAGMSAAAAARRENENISITVLEKGKYISYGSCAIPYYIEGVIPDWQPLVHHTPDEFKMKRNINVLIHAQAEHIDTENKVVTYLYKEKQEQIKYDKLLIAVGGTPFDPFKIAGKYKNLFVCRNVEHAQEIRKASDEMKNKKAIVLGSGYIGLEVACAFKSKGMQVQVFERNDNILSGFIPEISSQAFEYLTEKGIVINKNESVKDFVVENETVKKVVTDKGEYDADLILLAIGAKPATDFIKETGIELGKLGEVVINKSMETNIKDIWSAGDCAGTYNAFTGKYIYFPLAQGANKQGKIAGINMASGKKLELKGVVKSQAMKLFGLEIASVGFNLDEAKENGFNAKMTTIESFTKAYKHLGGGKIKISLIYDFDDGTILGAQLIGASTTAIRVDIFTVAIYNKMKVNEFWNMDLVYVPPVAPVYDSCLIAARQAINEIGMES